ncbi:WecB/TagA/CpsF family glycosyltransferase [Alkaliphilus peptidifermentans]|uniref:N-acetylglucosaminyldiphosphoundecaprenol N-acetyl-beta-D-mannosaminyltransferase n=1 Tax=Alkaliphilus peptidifermentans DSM 18978 TaxID=1120976 RepID=A0A1G5GDV5_9FIRM|nr:WecB/TagA/CpsF family glycosyltransferase [Alkaliphilus peptidifermentans]SCY48888.1 N-acetylmannosaminyltransferase [Alkaliphilus peptidifermentans DSM 18978]
MKRVEILNVPIHAVSQHEAVEALIGFLNQDKLMKVYTPNPEIVMLAQADEGLLNILKDGDLVVPDGIGLIMASKLKGLGLKERVTGVDLTHRLLSYCGNSKKSVFILGGKPDVPEKAAENIENKYNGIKIAGTQHGYFKQEENEEIINSINSSKADVLFVCLGAPRQEIWIDDNKDKLNCRIAIGLGGGVDIYAGTAKRAPMAYQKLGLEWFYRLMKEPKRYKRMLLLPKFLVEFLIKG